MIIANQMPPVRWVKFARISVASMDVVKMAIADLRRLASTKSVRIRAQFMAHVVRMQLASQ